jgi:hypothetical protein
MFQVLEKPVTASFPLSDIEQPGRGNGHFAAGWQGHQNRQSRNFSKTCGKAVYGNRDAR